MAHVSLGMIRRLAMALGFLTLLQACSPLAALNSVLVHDDPVVGRDIAYGSDPRQRLDVYAPTAAADLPVVVFIYGGSWKSGDRRDYRFVASQLARAGIITVIPDYRLYPQIRFPAFVDDAGAAVAWTARNIAAFGGDPRRIVIAGHSAGAQMAALVALNRRYLPPDVAIAGLVGIAGPYAFDPFEYKDTRDVFAGLQNPDEARAITFADARSPPAMLMHGNDDGIVYDVNSKALADRLTELGVPVTYHVYDGAGHIGIMLALYPGLGWIAPTLADTVAAVHGFPARDAP